MNGDGIMKGAEIKTRYKELGINWVGRRYYGLQSFIEDVNAGTCGDQLYQYSNKQINNNRWFRIEDFLKHYKSTK